MISQKPTTPSADPETVPQISGDDSLDIGNIPAFLRRTPKPAASGDRPSPTWPREKGN